jgi:hypothetical protein
VAVTSIHPVLAAFHATLAGNITSGGSIVPVYNSVRQGTATPYIVLGEVTEVRFDTHDRAGKELTVTLHVWSNYAGDSEGLQILEQVDALLDRSKPVVTGWRTVSVLNDSTQTMAGAGPFRQVVARYRVKVEKEA